MLRRTLLLSGVVFAVPINCWLGAKAAAAMTTSATVTGMAPLARRHGPPMSQEQLVDYLIGEGLVSTRRVADALLAVDRARYVHPGYVDVSRGEAYQDRPLLNGAGQTISAPHMHAICMELLAGHLGPGTTALDVGSGSGYLTAAMAKMGGRVLGVEQVASLVSDARRHVEGANPELLQGDPPQMEMRTLNVLADDAVEQLAGWAPFDAIHVGAAAAELPDTLVGLLKPGGRMVIPVGEQHRAQTLLKVDKSLSGGIRTERLLSVGYVPLTPPSATDEGGYLWIEPT